MTLNYRTLCSDSQLCLRPLWLPYFLYLARTRRDITINMRKSSWVYFSPILIKMCLTIFVMYLLTKRHQNASGESWVCPQRRTLQRHPRQLSLSSQETNKADTRKGRLYCNTPDSWRTETLRQVLRWRFLTSIHCQRTELSGTSLNVPFLFQEHDTPNFLKKPQICQHIRVGHRKRGLQDTGQDNCDR